MKIAPIILVILVLYACSKKEESIFFEGCSCDKIDFSNGIKITDSLKHYSVKYPASIWQPINNLDEFHNGITGMNRDNKELEILAITETIKGDSYVSAEEEIKKPPFNKGK